MTWKRCHNSIIFVLLLSSCCCVQSMSLKKLTKSIKPPKGSTILGAVNKGTDLALNSKLVPPQAKGVALAAKVAVAGGVTLATTGNIKEAGKSAANAGLEGGQTIAEGYLKNPVAKAALTAVGGIVADKMSSNNVQTGMASSTAEATAEVTPALPTTNINTPTLPTLAEDQASMPVGMASSSAEATAEVTPALPTTNINTPALPTMAEALVSMPVAAASTDDYNTGITPMVNYNTAATPMVGYNAGTSSITGHNTASTSTTSYNSASTSMADYNTAGMQTTNSDGYANTLTAQQYQAQIQAQAQMQAQMQAQQTQALLQAEAQGQANAYARNHMTPPYMGNGGWNRRSGVLNPNMASNAYNTGYLSSANNAAYYQQQAANAASNAYLGNLSAGNNAAYYQQAANARSNAYSGVAYPQQTQNANYAVAQGNSIKYVPVVTYVPTAA